MKFCRTFRRKIATTLRKRAQRVKEFSEPRRERAAILLVQSPALSPPLPLARFSVFPCRPSNLGLFGASLQTPAPEKNEGEKKRKKEFSRILEDSRGFSRILEDSDPVTRIPTEI